MSSSRLSRSGTNRNGFFLKLNDFMRTPWYVALLSLLTLVCNLMGWELVLYTGFIVIGCYLALCGRDLLPLAPIVILSYISPSPSNNPGSSKNSGSIFLPENGGIYLLVLVSIFAVCLIVRLCTDKTLGRGNFVTKKRSLLSGLLLLAGAYLLSGLGMEPYGSASWKFLLWGGVVLLAVFLLQGLGKLIFRKASLVQSLPGKAAWAFGLTLLLAAYAVVGAVSGKFGDLPSRNLLFALIQALSVVAMYYLFSGMVNWQLAPKDYLAWVGMCAGFVVMPQLLENYLSGRIFMEGTGTIDRELIYAGWGMHNNIGGMMAFMLPFPFYLACTRRRGWVFNLLGTVLLLGVLLSCSRGSIMVGLAIYAVCILLVLRNKAQRKSNLLVCGIALSAVVVAGVIYFQELMEIFALFIEEIFIMSERDNLVGYGWKQFRSHPIFGGSFFPQGEYVPWDWSTSEAFSSFFPPRWHNTIIQILASCGIVGMVCYLFHRFQTIRLMLVERSVEKTFIGLFMASLLLCSLMDCHFFNVGPVLFYSMALAFGENIHHSKV